MEVQFTSDITVKMIDSMADDVSIARAAWVSTKGERAEDEINTEKIGGLINYLMKHRHGCYDDETDVLTSDGWKHWPEVDGSETFVTLNLITDEVEYQAAERVVHKSWVGPMLSVKTSAVDALVTLDHRMVAAPRRHEETPFGLYPARQLLDRSHRLRLAGGVWQGGSIHAPDEAAVIGFLVADGTADLLFHLRRPRKIAWLKEYGGKIGNVVSGGPERFLLVDVSCKLREWAQATYTTERDRCFPRELLLHGDLETLEALLAGFLQGDGSVSASGKVTCSTVSRHVVDGVQELALKVGLVASETAPDVRRKGAFGERPLYRVTVYRDRNSEPRIGWTPGDRAKQVTVVPYDGMVHCVSVPNGTLYVRRRGKPMWCGNTPFEHNAFTFLVKAPIFVFREWHRHRVAWSYNEVSGRYSVLPPLFYIPPKHRPLINAGTSARPKFEPGTAEQYQLVKTSLEANAYDAYDRYTTMLENGIGNEVARMVLPVNTFTAMYATANARSIMHFLSLRTEHDDAAYPSHPMWEIAQAAETMEEFFKGQFPITHEAFVKNGRVAP